MFCSSATLLTVQILITHERIPPTLHRPTHQTHPPIPTLQFPLPHLLAHPDGLPSRIRVDEDIIDLLERQIRRLRIHKVHERHERKVGAHEDQIRLPVQPVQDDGRDHDHEKIPDPVARDAGGGALGARVQGQDLGHVDPGDAVGGGAEDEHVGEEEGDGGAGGLFADRRVLEGEQDGDQHHRDA